MGANPGIISITHDGKGYIFTVHSQTGAFIAEFRTGAGDLPQAFKDFTGFIVETGEFTTESPVIGEAVPPFTSRLTDSEMLDWLEGEMKVRLPAAPEVTASVHLGRKSLREAITDEVRRQHL